MTRRRALLPLVLLPAAAALPGCAGRAPAPRATPAPPPPRLLEWLQARQSALRAALLETRTTSWLGGDRLVAEVDMAVERSGRLRFGAGVRLRGTVATLVTDGRTFALRDDEQRVFRQGPACVENVASLLRIPLLPAEVAAVLLGDAPLREGARAVSASWDADARADVLALEQPGAPGGATTRLWVTLRPRTTAQGEGLPDVIAVEGEGPGRPGRWRVRYEDLERDGPLSRPGKIRFAEPGKSFDDGVEIRVKGFTGNPTLKDETFTLSPDGYPVEQMPCCRGCEVKIKT